jgi:hypothetical protein
MEILHRWFRRRRCRGLLKRHAIGRDMIARAGPWSSGGGPAGPVGPVSGAVQKARSDGEKGCQRQTQAQECAGQERSLAQIERAVVVRVDLVAVILMAMNVMVLVLP